MNTLKMMMNPAPAEELPPEEPAIEPAAEPSEAPVTADQQPEAGDAAAPAEGEEAPQSVASSEGGASQS